MGWGHSCSASPNPPKLEQDIQIPRKPVTWVKIWYAIQGGKVAGITTVQTHALCQVDTLWNKDRSLKKIKIKKYVWNKLRCVVWLVLNKKRWHITDEKEVLKEFWWEVHSAI